MSYLGYDRGRLLALRRRLGDLADEVAALRLPDPAAADAYRQYRDAATSLTGWLPDIAAIDACGFSSPYRPVALDPADPALVDVLHPGDSAWTTVTDPRATTAVAADVHARHLAEYVAALDLSRVLDDGNRTAELTHLLQTTMTDATSRSAFLETLGPARFTAIAEDLAVRIAAAGASSQATTQAARAAAMLDVLAAGWGAAERTGGLDGGAWTAQLAERTDPYATALVLRSAGLAADDLGRLAAAAWRRWERWAGDGIDEAIAADEQTPAILLATLAAKPLAARRALDAFDDADLGVMFGASIDPEDVLAVLLASADPRFGPPDDVERSMVNVLTFLAHHQDLAGAAGVVDGLGAYAGPYLENLLGASDSARYPARPWDLHGEDPHELLGWIGGSLMAAASLESYLDAIVLRRFNELATPIPDRTLLHHLGAIAGAVDGIVADGGVLRAEQRNAIWNATVDSLANLFSTFATPGLPGSGIALSRLVTGSINIGVGWLLPSWTPGSDPAAVVAAAGDRIEERRGRREAAILAATFGVARSAGAMPASAAPPPYDPDESYLVTRNRWLDAASPGDRADRQQLWDAAEAFDAGMSGALDRYS